MYLFFLTPEGRLYYKLVVDPEHYPVYEFRIAPEEVSLAENALRKVRVVAYSPFGGVLALFSEDGLVIDNLAPVTSIARLELI